MLMRGQKQKGFTIVELLIVIVVIAILAAITIVAYNGIQTRANESSAAAYASASLKLIGLYKAGEDSYPTGTGCLGGGYVDQNSDGSLDCRWQGATSSNTVNSTLNTAFSKYGSTSYSVPSFTASNGTSRFVGGSYSYVAAATLDGVAQPYWFVYVTPTRNCPVGQISKIGAVTWYNFTTDSAATNSEPWASGSLCWVALK